MKRGILIALLLVAGCSRPMTPQREARLVREGLKVVPEVAEFATVYPNATHHVLWAGGDWTWMSVAGLHQRYEVRMSFSMDLGLFDRVRPKGSVSVDVLEVESFTTRGTLKIKSYTQNQRQLAGADWSTLKNAKGDIEAIGFPVITNAPVPNFEDALLTR